MRSFIYHSIKILLLLVLPFIVLIRGAVFFHEQYVLTPWIALIGGVMFSAILIFFYIVYIQAHFTGKLGTAKQMRRSYWLGLTIMTVYCIPALLFLSAANAKHSEVKNEFTSLHPVLRLGISTLVFIERDLLITDAKRQPEDYNKMGLPKKKNSLHYKQSDGYAHAIDIRTIGHSEFRNKLVERYFSLMGFNTLRHVGTADHLHVSIKSHDRPGAI